MARIAFFCERCLPFHAFSLDERPLGGTETGVIRLAGLLTEAGHDVTVFTTHQLPPPSRTRYLPCPAVKQAQPFDFFVSVKDWLALFYPIPSRLRFFWTGDSFDQYINFGLGDRRVAERLDCFLAVSRWQAEQLCLRSGLPLSKARVIGNGIWPAYFEGTEQRHRKRLIYSSAPYRGLALTPQLFSAVRKLVPDAEFHVFSGLAIYDGAQPFEGPERAQLRAIQQQLQKIPGCVLRENCLQAQLAREFMKSSIFFYPNTFLETSCISALEAMGAGSVPVTSALGALGETIGDAGALITGNPTSAEYAAAFVEATRRLLTDDTLWQSLSQRAMARIRAQGTWQHVAARMLQVLEEFEDTDASKLVTSG